MGKLGPIGGLMKALHGPVYASRLKALSDAIIPHLREGDSVIDVGCGVGTLGKALLDDERCPASVNVRGLERVVRGGEPIEVIGYDGKTFPLEDDSVDIIIMADVLHHEEDPDRLLKECARVTKRLFIIKDHLVAGPLAQQRISLIDWAANAPHGVPCLYRYYTDEQWQHKADMLGMETEERRLGMKVYPPIFEQFFGGRLHYFAALRKPGDTEARTEADRETHD